ncbi:MAG: Si-specific NAD(P)(+) transhydrogenase [Candidatus Tectomicrobia bacterium]|uniref:Soluble pyridine nucleotide transhydrogenase n=1 Tax=Tectimicrobiota bacterium TaxID=2528274 RepID=A0A932GQG4_UNCTE|nr:Si-specific NAD(P)(+) transhydrogenase [Candidatus Tectomicrobia bacterium]
MMHYDLVVIGSGPAGEKGAAQAAYFGKKVLVIEAGEEVGGAGVNTGTIPSKTLRETALYFSGLRQRGLYGIDYSLKENLTIPDFMFRKDRVIENAWQRVRQNLKRHGIDLLWGQASFEDPRTLRVVGKDGETVRVTGDVILIATGSVPHRPPSVPFDDQRVYDSDSILRMDRIPGSLAVIGGGVIGCEYASIFTALGVKVTLIDGRDRLLPFLDGEISERLRMQLSLLSAVILLEEEVAFLEPEGDGVYVALKSGKHLRVDRVLHAAGRQGNSAGLNLEAVGIQTTPRGHIVVNDRYQTSVPHVYAAGDVIGFPALAATSMEQARVAMCHAFDLKYKTRVSPHLPLAIYTIPEISMIGETEESCRQKGIAYCAGRALYAENARGQIIGDCSGMLKLLFSAQDLKLVGVHIIGEMASEVIHLGAAVLAAGETIDVFIQSVFNYPTLSDAYKYAAYDGLGNLQRMNSSQLSASEGRVS